MITKAVIPAAGLGTRFLPITKSMPKEMLPILGVPVIHHVVAEAYSSGIEDILIITGRGKRAIEDYFDASPELETFLKKHNKEHVLDTIAEILDHCKIHYIRQKEPKGLGDAILQAESYVGSNPFAVLLGDDIVINTPSCLSQLITQFNRFNASILSVESVTTDRVDKYGIIKGIEIEEGILNIEDIIEKPKKEEAPSNLASVGRYIFKPEIFKCLRSTTPGKGGEIQLTDAIQQLIHIQTVCGVIFKGKRYDTGDIKGYLETVIDFALEDPELSGYFHSYLSRRLSTSSNS